MGIPLYIFDLDGTLALIEHRKHYLSADYADDSTRWRRFYAACDKDEPNKPVCDTLERLRRFADCWIFSGRSDEVRDKTEAWLCTHTSFMRHDLDTALVMRKAGDYRPDDVLKKEFLDLMLDEDRKRLVAVFDDRDRVVKMWRANGIPCFQVAEGEF